MKIMILAVVNSIYVIALCTNYVTNFWSLLTVTQTLNLIDTRILYGKVTFVNKFSSSLKIFIVKRNRIKLVFDKVFPKNN